MTPDALRQTLHGVIAFPVTPFRSDLSLDAAGLRANIRVILQHPVCAVVAPGGTGELYSLTPAEHLEVVKIAVEETAGKVPVIAGAGFNPPIAAQLAKQAAAAGASGILAFPPYYPHAEADGMIDYYQVDRRGHAARAADLQPRLVPSRPAHGRTDGRCGADPDRVEGRSGRHPPPVRRSCTALGEPPALDRRRRRRHGRRLLFARHPHLHVEHLEHRAGALARTARRCVERRHGRG